MAQFPKVRHHFRVSVTANSFPSRSIASNELPRRLLGRHLPFRCINVSNDKILQSLCGNSLF